MPEFEPFAGEELPGRLCRDMTAKSAPLNCALEGGSFAPEGLVAGNDVVVLAYNVERGTKWREQLTVLAEDPGVPSPDVVLLSEADRGCGRSGTANVALEYARALRMNYAYGVEFVELPRCIGPDGRIDAPCEHGNAILSRFPIGNVRLMRHARNRSWNSWWQRLIRIGEPRLGGRMALAADIDLGDRLLRVYSVHFESKGGDQYRPAQAAEVAEDGLAFDGGIVIGGDMNFGSYREQLEGGGTEDPGAQALAERGYSDAHASLSVEQRITTRSGHIVDCIFVRGLSVIQCGVGARERWGELSDHLPVWARLAAE
jgi:endonuclease/exonuclease/phosphatase family metal-dependent hydrolase